MVGMIPVGEVEAAGDLTTAANIRNSLAASQKAVDERVAIKVPEVIGDDTTVINAAAAAVSDQLADFTVPLPYASQAMLELAKTDGWLAVYDPTNPHTRSISGGKVMSIQDALGNLPPMSASSAPAAPAFEAGHFGGFDGLRFRDGGVANALRTGAFTPELDQPMFVMVVAQDRTGVADPDNSRFIVDGATSSGRNGIAITRFEPQSWMIFAGSQKRALNAPLDNLPHVVGGLFDGSDGSRLFVDGAPQFFAGTGDFTQPMSGITYGNVVLGGGVGASWDGWGGPLLVFDGEPPADVLDRMTRLLRGSSTMMGYEGVNLGSRAALYQSRAETFFKQEEYQPRVPASLTKIMAAWIVREGIIDSRLDDLVTVQASDGLIGSAPELLDGDQISYRDLLYLMMLSSHNAASRIVARAVGEQLLGSGSPMEKFVAAMNARAASWGWEGAFFFGPSGLESGNRMSPEQVAELLFRIEDEDPILLNIMGTLTQAIEIDGPNERTLTAVHTINPEGEVPFPEFIAGKPGYLTSIGGNLAMLVNVAGESRAIVTMIAQPARARFIDARNLIDQNITIHRTPASVAIDALLRQALLDNSSEALARLYQLFEPLHTTPSGLNINDRFTGADFDEPGAAVTVQRSGRVVELTIDSVKFPPGFSQVTIPSGYRPSRPVFGESQGALIRVGMDGMFTFIEGSSSDVVRMSCSWLTSDAA